MWLVIVLSDWGIAFSLLAFTSPIINIFNFPEEISGFFAVWGCKHKHFQFLCNAGLHTVKRQSFEVLRRHGAGGIRGQWDYIGTRIGIWTYSAPPRKPCSHCTTECTATCRERSRCAILSVKRCGQTAWPVIFDWITERSYYITQYLHSLISNFALATPCGVSVMSDLWLIPILGEGESLTSLMPKIMWTRLKTTVLDCWISWHCFFRNIFFCLLRNAKNFGV